MHAEVILTSLSILVSIVAVFLLVLLGWYIVWTFVLSHFKFIRELLRSGSTENSTVTELKTARSKSRSSITPTTRKLRRD